jgi:hypothetical protein
MISTFELFVFGLSYYFCFWILPAQDSLTLTISMTILLLIYPFAFNAMRKLSWKEMGYEKKALMPGLKIALLATVPIVIVTIIFGETRNYRPSAVLLGSMILNVHSFLFVGIMYFFFSFLQENIIMGFVVNRLERIVRNKFIVVVVTAVLFSLSHWPNLPLSLLTFAAGILFTSLFLSHRNIIPVAFLHCLLGLIVFSYFFRWVPSFEVGRAYTNHPSLHGHTDPSSLEP